MEDDIAEWAADLARTGYICKSDLRYMLEDEDISEEDIEHFFNTVWADRKAELAKNTSEDDSVRLSKAFESLRLQGVMAEENFTCCQTCGHAEIEKDKDSDWGYVFFHQQDSERILDGSLYLAYGVFNGVSSDRELAVAQTAAEELKKAGFSVEWNGSTNARLKITITDWRRPLADD